MVRLTGFRETVLSEELPRFPLRCSWCEHLLTGGDARYVTLKFDTSRYVGVPIHLTCWRAVIYQAADRVIDWLGRLYSMRKTKQSVEKVLVSEEVAAALKVAAVMTGKLVEQPRFGHKDMVGEWYLYLDKTPAKTDLGAIYFCKVQQLDKTGSKPVGSPKRALIGATRLMQFLDEHEPPFIARIEKTDIGNGKTMYLFV